MTDIVKAPPTHNDTTTLPDDGTGPKIGDWFFFEWKSGRDVGCVVEIGSNYVKLKHPFGASIRIRADRFWYKCERAVDAPTYIRARIEEHQRRAGELLDDVKRLTAGLGIVPAGAIASAAEEATTALAVAHDTVNIKAHKKALIKAKEETLPELFKQIKAEHEAMASWMKGELLPHQAQVKRMERVTEGIENRIFTVELYAGLCEDIEQIADGDPAPNDEKVRLFQRRHYMDEECLIAYRAGGMAFKNLGAFDKWLAQPTNRDRILPFPRCVVAFRVRRFQREYDGGPSISAFISFVLAAEQDKLTFLYVRNGERIYRLSTKIEFGEQLFPDREHSDVLGTAQIYTDLARWSGADTSHTASMRRHVITVNEYEGRLEDYQRARDKLAAELREWRKNGKHPDKKPWSTVRNEADGFEPINPDNVYYDDVMRYVAHVALEHNRMAVVLQGLLDRSPALQPHPPWRIWTPEGFAAGIDLIYDDSRAMVAGPKPDFEAYRARLNAAIKIGSITVGQEDAWERHEAEKRNNSYRYSRDGYRTKRHRPYGNPGPGLYGTVRRVSRKGGCTYEWEREAQGRWRRDEMLTTRFTCPSSELLNVSAYKAGDFKQFFNDPRTRAEYIKWAPLLLAAEDYVLGKHKKDKS